MGDRRMDPSLKIEARRISLCFTSRQGQTATALDCMDFTVGIGDTTGVLGPSGSGKSSLLYVLSGLLRPTTGKVFYSDQDIAGWSPEERENYRRRYVGFIFQRHYLINHLTLLENILLPLFNVTPEDETRALTMLDELCPGLPADSLPGSLSVGQRQLVAVARALINQPRIIFADEPTAALDMNTAMTAMHLITRQAQDAAIVVVTHDVKILRNAGKIIKLRDGRLV